MRTREEFESCLEDASSDLGSVSIDAALMFYAEERAKAEKAIVSLLVELTAANEQIFELEKALLGADELFEEWAEDQDPSRPYVRLMREALATRGAK